MTPHDILEMLDEATCALQGVSDWKEMPHGEGVPPGVTGYQGSHGDWRFIVMRDTRSLLLEGTAMRNASILRLPREVLEKALPGIISGAGEQER